MKFELIQATVATDEDGFQEGETAWGEAVATCEAPYPPAVREAALAALGEAGIKFLGTYQDVDGATFGMHTDRGLIAVRVVSA